MVKIIADYQRMISARPDGTITYDGPAGSRKPRSNLTDDDPDRHH